MPEGRPTPELAAQRAYRYDPLTPPNYYPFSVPLILEFTKGTSLHSLDRPLQ
jgi:hypothetical protein